MEEWRPWVFLHRREYPPPADPKRGRHGGDEPLRDGRHARLNGVGTDPDRGDRRTIPERWNLSPHGSARGGGGRPGSERHIYGEPWSSAQWDATPVSSSTE